MREVDRRIAFWMDGFQQVLLSILSKYQDIEEIMEHGNIAENDVRSGDLVYNQ